jgi:pyrrolidone-carboxylate peptidase
VTIIGRLLPGVQPDLAKPITLDIQDPANAQGLTIEVNRLVGKSEKLLATFTGDLVKGVFKPKTSTIAHPEDGLPRVRLNFRGAEPKVFDLGITESTDDTDQLFWEISFTVKQGGKVAFKAAAACQVRRLLVRFLAIDGTRSPDADSFARNMAKQLKGTWNVANALDPGDKLFPYLRKTSGNAALAFNFQQNPENQVALVMPGSPEHVEVRTFATRGGVPTKTGFQKANFLYLAMHAYLDGGLAFLNTNDDKTGQLVNVFDPEGNPNPKDPFSRLDWTGVKWVIVAACGALSPHYRWFGIPHENYLDYTDDNRLALTTRASFLNWLRILRDLAKRGNQVHGLLGYWSKAPGGDAAGGETVDAKVARVFCEKLSQGKSIPGAWLEANPGGSDGWAVLCDDRFKEETFEDLRLEKISDSPMPKDGPKYVYSDKTFSSGLTATFTDPKTAFLEGNKDANFQDKQLRGITVRVHPTYDRALIGDQVPKELSLHNWAERVFVKDASGGQKPVVQYDKNREQNVYVARCWFHPTIHTQLLEVLPDLTDDEISALHPKHRMTVLLTGFVDFPAASITNHPEWFREIDPKTPLKPLPPAQRVPVRNSSGFAVEKFDPTSVDAKITGDVDLSIVKIQDLPVAYQRAAKLVLMKIEDERPDIVISFGFGADTFAFSQGNRTADADLETRASNLRNDLYPEPFDPKKSPSVRKVLPPPSAWPPLAKGPPENWTDQERAFLSSSPDNDRVSYGATPIDDTGPDFIDATLPVGSIRDALAKEGQLAAVDRNPLGGAGHYVCNEVFYTGTGRQKDDGLLGGFIHLPEFRKDDATMQQKLVQVVKIAIEQTVKFWREAKH